MIPDLSRYDRIVDWPAAHAGGVDIAILCAGYGLLGDPYFARNVVLAKKAGVRRVMAYWATYPSIDRLAQEERLLANFEAFEGELADGYSPLSDDPIAQLPPLWNDAEKNGGKPPVTVRVFERAFTESIQQTAGVECGIYTAPYWWDANVGNQPWAAQHALWIAHYLVAAPRVPRPWHRYHLWQYTDRGTCPGVTGTCDMNRLWTS